MPTLFISLTGTEINIFATFYLITTIIGLIQIYNFNADTMKRLILLIILVIPVIGIIMVNVLIWKDKKDQAEKLGF